MTRLKAGSGRSVIDIDDLKREVDEAMLCYCNLGMNEFSIIDALEFAEANLGESEELEDLVIDCLDDSPYVFSNYENGNYKSRSVFFRGRKFLISPTPMERKLGILIPGHRFIPFVQRFLPPSTYTVKGPRGKELVLKQVRMKLRDLHIFYTLFDYSRTMEFLVSEDERNAKVLLAPDVDDSKFVYVWAFDIAHLLPKMPSDGNFEITVENWMEGIFKLKSVPPPENGVQQWCTDLEESLAFEVIGLLGPETDIGEQLAWAFYLGPNYLTRSPKIHIGGFLSHMEELDLIFNKGVPMLWVEGVPPDELFPTDMPDEPLFSGAVDSIDGILTDIGSNLREIEIEAYMRDTLYQGRKSLLDAQQRMSQNRIPLEFINQQQEDAFNGLVAQLWERVSEGYNRFTDQRPGKCRHDCLVILDSVVAWMSRLSEQEVRIDILPKKEFLAITSLASMIFHTLAALNLPSTETHSEELNSLTQTLPNFQEQAEQLMQSINHQLAPQKPVTKPKSRPVFRVIKGGKQET